MNAADFHWLLYALAKAAWWNEPALREMHGGAEEAAKVSLEEEMLAIGVLAGTYANALESGGTEDGEEEPVRIQALDRLLEAVRTGHFRAYVLYEVIHKAYGVRLERLPEADATGVEEYLRHVLRMKKAE